MDTSEVKDVWMIQVLDHRLIRIKVRNLFFILPVKPVAGGEFSAKMWATNDPILTLCLVDHQAI
jgi:hypothetical protein